MLETTAPAIDGDLMVPNPNKLGDFNHGNGKNAVANIGSGDVVNFMSDCVT